MSPTFEYGYGSNAMIAFSRHLTVEQAAAAICRSIPERLRPDSDELTTLQAGERLLLREGRYVERVA